MTLIRKDGTPYRLSGPNPLAATQEDIKSTELEFHNFKWQTEVRKDRRLRPATQVQAEVPVEKAIEKPPEKPAVTRSVEVQESLKHLKEEAKVLKAEVPTPPPAEELHDPDTILVYCLPATIRVKKDDVYNEERKTIQFGNKFQFEAVMVDSNDLELVLFSKTNISNGSILYPSKYKNGESIGECRWWKVAKNSPSHDGFLLLCLPTDQQFDFSG